MSQSTMTSSDNTDKSRQNLRTGLTLGSIALAIFIGFLFRAGLFGQ